MKPHKKFVKLYKKYGVQGLYWVVSQASKDPFGLLENTETRHGGPLYQNYRIDNQRRSEVIYDNLGPQINNLLDVGCNAGTVSDKIHQLSVDDGDRDGVIQVYGFDMSKSNITKANRLYNTTGESGVSFIYKKITPDNVENLPSFDSILIANVYYHWGEDWGYKEANKMLLSLRKSCDELFIETPLDNRILYHDELNHLMNRDGGRGGERGP
jgi:SAM-dependent methyltransferase